MAHLHVKTPNGTAYSIDLDAVNSSGGSSSSNGWLKFSNGLIIQWGNPEESSSETDYRNFPITFSNLPYIAIVGAHLMYLPNNNAGVGPWIYVYSKAQFIIGASNDYTGIYDAFHTDYIAIGP